MTGKLPKRRRFAIGTAWLLCSEPRSPSVETVCHSISPAVGWTTMPSITAFSGQPNRIARCSCSTLLRRHCCCGQLESCFASSHVATVQRNGTQLPLIKLHIHTNRSFHCLNHLLQLSGAFFIIAHVNTIKAHGYRVEFWRFGPWAVLILYLFSCLRERVGAIFSFEQQQVAALNVATP